MAAPVQEKAARQGPAGYFVIFLHPVADRPIPADVMRLHASHLAELDAQHKLVLAGPVPDRSQGLLVLDVEGLAAARLIAEEDPLIRGGYQTYEIGTWILSTAANHYLPNLHPESRQ